MNVVLFELVTTLFVDHLANRLLYIWQIDKTAVVRHHIGIVEGGA